MKTITMAIIGYGKSATRYHIPYIQKLNLFEIKYIYDNNYVSNQEDFYFVDNLEVILNDKDVSLVSICTPPSTHFDLAKQCIMHGKNVIIEKPFCSNVQQAHDLLELAKEYHVIALPFQNRRYDSDYLTLKEVLKYEYVGKPVELESHTDYFRPNSEIKIGTKENGMFYGLAVHSIDQIISLFGKPNYVYYDIRNIQNHESHIDDYYDVQFFYDSLKVILKSSQLVATAYPKFILHGTQGSYIKYEADQQENDLKIGKMPTDIGFGEDVSQQYGHIKYQNISHDWIEKTIPSILGGYEKYYQAIYNTIINKVSPFISDEEILTTMEILEMGLKADGPTVLCLKK